MGIRTDPLSEDRWRDLQAELQAAVSRSVPDWTDASGHDPGVAFVELFAFLAVQLTARSPQASEEARRWLRLALETLQSIDTSGSAAAAASAAASQFSGPTRPHFFAGRLLSADDLRVEQEYQLEKRFLHNRALHGSGIANGLALTVDSDRGVGVVVSPGLAIDSRGREVWLAEPLRVPLTTSTAPRLVVLRYTERAIAPMAAAGEEPTPSGIEEGASVHLIGEQDDPGDGVIVGRIVPSDAGWAVDETFDAGRCR
jgi:hypothetical protein